MSAGALRETAEASGLTLAAPPECASRPYCLPGFERVYGQLPDTVANAVAHADITGDLSPLLERGPFDVVIAGDRASALAALPPPTLPSPPLPTPSPTPAPTPERGPGSGLAARRNELNNGRFRPLHTIGQLGDRHTIGRLHAPPVQLPFLVG